MYSFCPFEFYFQRKDLEYGHMLLFSQKIEYQFLCISFSNVVHGYQIRIALMLSQYFKVALGIRQCSSRGKLRSDELAQMKK